MEYFANRAFLPKKKKKKKDQSTRDDFKNWKNLFNSVCECVRTIGVEKSNKVSVLKFLEEGREGGREGMFIISFFFSSFPSPILPPSLLLPHLTTDVWGGGDGEVGLIVQV